SDVHEELNQLRKEVAALSAARKQKEDPTTRDDDEASTDSETGDAGHAIRGQIEELIKLLQDEFRDMPAATALAVFALGILLGRYLR
ncbi:MAG: hypothetical protein O3A51_12005, partial [Verrucomicrobia bacterium]|nr:hypothetical protein [Verrucomicrobiota bacterium]